MCAAKDAGVRASRPGRSGPGAAPATVPSAHPEAAPGQDGARDVVAHRRNPPQRADRTGAGARWGYQGSFGGPGWDSMWLDMSEIVRPTRDGIHGREYIATTVEVGARPAFLRFDREQPALT